MTRPFNSREFFQAASAGLILGHGLAATAAEPSKPRSPNKRLGVGAVGLRYQGTGATFVAQR